MLKAVKKASDYINSDREDSVKILAKAIDFDETELTKIMTRNEYCWGVNQNYKDSLLSLEDFMVDKKIIKKKPNYDDFNDFSLLKEALPDCYEIKE